MIKKFLSWSALITLALIGLACTGQGPNYSSNVTTTLNITGNYGVAASPNGAITSMTITQTGNLVQAIDNTGTVYEGSTTGDITSTNVNLEEDGVLTATITIQGRNGAGVLITIIMTQINYLVSGVAGEIIDESGTADTDLTVNLQDTQQTNVANGLVISGLTGTYTDESGLSGYFALVNDTFI